MSEQRLEGFAKAKTATPFIASEQKRQDNIFVFGQAQFVIPHLLRDLKEKIRSRNESGMTAVSCHCEGATHVDMHTTLDILSCHSEVPEARHHVSQYSCALPCHPEATTEGSQEVNEILKHLTASPTDAGSHNSFLVGSLCKVQHDKYVSKAHSKELNVLTSYRLNDFKKKIAFTLAEVLITLAIIGVVAAMTIPTLIADYQEKQTVTRLAKAYATINNAYQMVKVEDGELNSWGFSNNSITSDSDVDQEIKDQVNSANANLFLDKLSKYLKVSERIDNSDKKYRRDFLGGTSKNVNPGYTILVLTDGTCISGGHISNYKCKSKDICGDFTIDINGVKTPPNEIGRDVFYFYVYGSGIVPLGTVEDTNRSFEIYCDKDGTVKFNGYGCTAWVIYNKNMDYLHCDDLAWDGKHKCSD